MDALAGRRVVVTRAGEQAAALVDLLLERGAVPVLVPMIEIVPDDAGVDLLMALDPSTFDWLVVTSPNAARAYVRLHS
ncbi:MAG: uroporphyrinogen-III synthase, partial [Actinomycetota bacterium]